MDQQTTQTITAKEIVFPNGNRVQLVTPSASASSADIIKALGLKKPQAIIILSGGAGLMDEKFAPRLVQLFSRGVAQIAEETDALIVDGGTQSGVMQLMGQGIADRGRQTSILGVAPAGQVTYPDGPAHDTPLDPNHSHFILVDAQDWGGETDTMYSTAAALGKNIPVITILVNGGGIAKQEILRSVRYGWPVIVLENSGRLADEIAELWQEKPDFIPDPVVAEIIADGTLHLFPLEGTVVGLQRLLRRLIDDYTKGNTTLELTWQRFAQYDNNAESQQRSFKTRQFIILALGVLVTLLALTQTTLEKTNIIHNIGWLDWILWLMIVIIPIMVSMLIAAANRFSEGNKWVQLRGSTEAIKREIYRYRANAEIYSKAQTTRTSPEIKLTQKMESISRKLMQTEVNLSALPAYTGPIPPTRLIASGDDGMSDLTPDQYITFRLEDQLNFYQIKSVKLAQKLRNLQWITVIAGGTGTLLAAVGLELWVALTTALVTAIAAYLEYQQIEKTLMNYNQSAADLANVRAWWLALSAEAQAVQQNIDKLVNHTEMIIKKEHAGWIQDMQDALAELRAEQAGTEANQKSTPKNEEN